MLNLKVSSAQKNHRRSWPWGMQTSQKMACFSSAELTTSSVRCQPRFVDVSHNPNFSAASRLFCLHCFLKSKFHALLCRYLSSCSFRSRLFSVLSLLLSHFLKGWRVISPLIPFLAASEISNKKTRMLKAVSVQPQEPRVQEAAWSPHGRTPD